MLILRAKIAMVCVISLMWGGCGDLDGVDVGMSSAPIVGGWAATDEEIYATVEIRRRGASQGFCAGTRIAPRVIVTAAHCVVRADEDSEDAEGTVVPARQLSVAGGHLGADDGHRAEVVSVEEVIVYPDYDHAFILGRSREGAGKGGMGTPHDISLLVLEVPMMHVAIAPVLPAQLGHQDALRDAVGWVSGYGVYDLESEKSGELFVTDARIENVGPRELLTRRIDELGDSCFGDSGGPLYVGGDDIDHLVGLVSRGRSDVSRDCGDGGVYTLVSSYDGWMSKRLGDLYTSGLRELPDPASFETRGSGGGCSVSARPGQGGHWAFLCLLAWACVRRARLIRFA